MAQQDSVGERSYGFVQLARGGSRLVLNERGFRKLAIKFEDIEWAKRLGEAWSAPDKSRVEK